MEQTINHLQEDKEVRHDSRTTQDGVNDAKLKGIVKNFEIFDRRLFLRAKQTGSWLFAQGTTVTSTVLLAMEFCNFLCVRRNVTPPPNL